MWSHHTPQNSYNFGRRGNIGDDAIIPYLCLSFSDILGVRKAVHRTLETTYLFSSSHEIVNIHYWDVIMGAMASQITRRTIVYSSVHSGTDQRSIKAPRHWALGNSPVTSEFPIQMASDAGNVSIWCCHHVSANHIASTCAHATESTNEPSPQSVANDIFGAPCKLYFKLVFA